MSLPFLDLCEAILARRSVRRYQ